MKESVKKSRLIKSITKIVNATIKWEIIVEDWTSWEYKEDRGIQTLIIDWKSILVNRWKYTLSKIFWTIWFNLYTDIPKDFVVQLKENRQAHAFALSSLEDLRVKNKMMYNFPGTRDLFFYSAKLDNQKITKEEELSLRPHKRLLYVISQDFYWLPFLEPNKEIYEAFLAYKKISEELLFSDSLSDMMKYFEEKLLDKYLKLYTEEEKTSSEDKEESLEESIERMKQKSHTLLNDAEEAEIKAEISELVWENEEVKEWGALVSYNDLYSEFSHLIPRFVRRLNSILKDNLYNRSWWAFRSWVLNKRKLFKVVVSDNKLFTRKLNRTHKDYVVSLLIDCSWSMEWEKIRLAIKSAALMSEVLSKVGMKFSVVCFNFDYNEHKTINQKYDYRVKNALMSAIHDHRGTAGNNDGYAINRANANMIANSNPWTERILIVLSDWRPAPDYLHREYDLSKEVTKASQYTKIIWIGIQDNAVESFYKDNIVIQNIELLPETLLNKLKNNIKRW